LSDFKYAYPDDYEDEVNTAHCRLRLLYSLITYGICALLLLFNIHKGAPNIGFIWPTLATLVKLNVILHASNYGKRYVYCIVGGMAGEGFQFYKTTKAKLEEKYRAALGIVFRNYQEVWGEDQDPDPCIITYTYYQWIFPFLVISLVMFIYFIFIYCQSRTRYRNGIYEKIHREIKWNAHLKYIFIFAMPLFWLSFMCLFYLRDWNDPGFADVVTICLSIFTILMLLMVTIFVGYTLVYEWWKL
jgi:hypothetical protein